MVWNRVIMTTSTNLWKFCNCISDGAIWCFPCAKCSFWYCGFEEPRCNQYKSLTILRYTIIFCVYNFIVIQIYKVILRIYTFFLKKLYSSCNAFAGCTLIAPYAGYQMPATIINAISIHVTTSADRKRPVSKGILPTSTSSA